MYLFSSIEHMIAVTMNVNYVHYTSSTLTEAWNVAQDRQPHASAGSRKRHSGRVREHTRSATKLLGLAG
eukprot:6193322-Pleurochrysis_carterae.AAC.1